MSLQNAGSTAMTNKDCIKQRNFQTILRGTWRMSRARRIALGAIGKWSSSLTYFTRQMTITSSARFLPLFFLHLSLTGWNEIQATYWRYLKHICKYLRGWLFALFAHYYHSFHSTRIARHCENTHSLALSRWAISHSGYFFFFKLAPKEKQLLS